MGRAGAGERVGILTGTLSQPGKGLAGCRACQDRVERFLGTLQCLRGGEAGSSCPDFTVAMAAEGLSKPRCFYP